MKTGIITKKNADLFFIDGIGYVARKNLKTDGIYVGDFVEYDEENKVIEKILKRKNLLVRPPLANVDKMLIVIAPVPKPDFVLIDKLIIYCELNNIRPVLIVNKKDLLNSRLKDEIEKIYSKIIDIFYVCSFDRSALNLKEIVKGICAFAGQSAVGKSSLINSIFQENKEKIGEISKHIERGKQTTRLVSLYKLGEDSFLADTSGFSKLDEKLLNLQSDELAGYFPDFLEFLPHCEYKTCRHIKEKNCAVKHAVEIGKISKQRYNSYIKIFEALKDFRRNYEKKN